jgi:leucyl-tRNA synthetase
VTRRAGKMGKSLKNGVSPEQIIAQYGADTLRLQEMASGPLEADRLWRPNDIAGVHRFLQRLWRVVISERTGQAVVSDQPPADEASRLLHRTISVVRKDYDELRFNTAIARLIELTTAATRIAAKDGALPRAIAEPLVLMVAPLAPHIAEEMWQRLGHDGSLAYEPFPVTDPALTGEAMVRLPVQVNGKTRVVVSVLAGTDQQEFERLLLTDPELTALTHGRRIERIVFVPDRIANIVVR